MAYQARPRDPFLDSDMQAAIEKRGKELFGFGLLAVGVMVTMLLLSYVPEDPSWMSATDEPAKNWLGRFGAYLASPLFIIVGFGAWAIPFVTVVWGLRFVMHRGEERAVGRLIFAPLAIALASVYASTHVPVSEWTHSFGLGGLFGDTVLGAILGVAPISATFGLKVLAFLVFFGLLFLSLFVLGFDRSEIKAVARFMLVGVILTYASIMKLIGSTGKGAVLAASKANEIRVQRKEARLSAVEESYQDDVPIPGPSLRRAPVVHAPQPLVAPQIEVEKPAAKPSLLARLPGLKPRDVEPELYDEPAIIHDDVDPEDRIKSKISDVIKNRGRRTKPLEYTDEPSMRAEPQLTRGRGPEPLRIDPAFHETAEQRYVDEDELIEPLSTAPTLARVNAPLTKPVVQQPVRKPVAPSKRAVAEAQPALQFEDNSSDFELPPLNLLTSASTVERHVLSDEALEENARMLEAVLDDYGVKGEIVSVRPGPVVTMYELEPAPGLKASRVIGLSDDIARSMSALSARVSTVPGRTVIGIELPNEKREMVVLREILSARDFGDGNQKLPLALGKDIGGEPIVANLAKMPHLLIAGTTGSGKSVAINTMILSLLYKLTPEECRLIMIDPKMLELSVYDGIPHLLSPVVTDPKKAVVALKWTVGEMEERYRKMSKMGVRNIDGYNSRVKDALAKGELFSRTVQTGFDDETGEPIFETEEFQPETMPYIVVVVDEMADLMMVAGKEIEACIQRLAQMARASGIHLIMATQRPSVDVITGTIKANFPTRISFQVTSKIDSRTILGEMGAEQLLGMGDMLYMAGGSKITRIHGPFVSDEEVEEIVNHLKSFGPPTYMSGVVEGPTDEKSNDIDMVLGLGGNTDGEDALYDTAVQIVLKDRKCSTSYIQRKLAIGYNKAARLVEQMEEEGVVSQANHVGKREILVPEQH
ncbi:DNA translocase FtsK [Litoreibacter ascidiaceicola]|uniref:DNA translocase FtsK n=1 Tax=Litoreibacter ascidiaceicola TaxID=1486859 RepID=A0A1M5D194_9RHOB|nr:DNA translocase FtsK [Litoreibacter ascidiaceicola]SHF60813.1 DNA translocase FtsK [Litoreibacter ascidiaceicola]